MKDEYALKIGMHVLKHYAKWTENPRGKAIVIPVKLPHHSKQPPWCMSVTCDMPWFIEEYYENVERKTKHWSMKEWDERNENP